MMLISLRFAASIAVENLSTACRQVVAFCRAMIHFEPVGTYLADCRHRHNSQPTQTEPITHFGAPRRSAGQPPTCDFHPLVLDICA
jgi:hypothetical protein